MYFSPINGIQARGGVLQGDKVIKVVPFAVGEEMRYVYLEPTQVYTLHKANP